MRFAAMVALTVVLGGGERARTEDLPEGSIGLKVELKDSKIVVKDSIKGGPADKAGIKLGDIVVKVSDYRVMEKVDQFELERAIRHIVKLKPGDKVKLELQRDGKEMAVEVTVVKRSTIYPKDKD